MITQAILDADQAAINAAQGALQNAQSAVTAAQAALDTARAKLAADVAQAQAEAHPILAVLDDIAARVQAQSEVLGVDFETAFAALVAKARALIPSVTLPTLPQQDPVEAAAAPTTGPATTTTLGDTAMDPAPQQAQVSTTMDTTAVGAISGTASEASAAPAADAAQPIAA